MNSICLSAALNLRCEGLTRTENIVLLVPPAIEIIFSITLAFARPPGRGHKNWLLVLDGFVFLLLVLLDFFSHIITQVSSTLVVFKIIDIVLAGASSVPILVYTLFLFLFARTNMLSSLPIRFRRILSFALFAIIPFIIAFSELGSLLGIEHRLTLLQDRPVVTVGFSNPLMQRMSLFFSAGTLALLTLFQASVFCLTFIQLVRAFLEERRIEASRGQPGAPDEIHLFRGIGWFAAGLKLGAIETVVGFANISFEVVLTRRVLRLFSRGAIIIGVIKGMNMIEDFDRFKSDVKARRISSKRLSKPKLQLPISNPRFSTFREMSPHASTFHAAQAEKRGGRPQGRLGPSPLGAGPTPGDISKPIVLKPQDDGPKGRVTVAYDGKTPPVLNLRFSALNLPVPPLPATIAPLPKSALPAISEGSESPRSKNPDVSALILRRVSRSQTRGVSTIYNSVGSNSPLPISTVSDRFEAMREIVPRFPDLPTRADPVNLTVPQAALHTNAESRPRDPQQLREGENTYTAPSSANVSPVNSIKRKPVPASVPVPVPAPTAPQRPEQRPPPLDLDGDSMYTGGPQYSSAAPRSPVSVHSADSESHYSTQSHATPSLTRASTLETLPTTPGHNVLGRFRNSVIAMADNNVQQEEAWNDESRRDRLIRLQNELHASAIQIHAETGEELSWMRKDPVPKSQTISKGRRYSLAPKIVDEEAAIDEAWRHAGLSRIKTVSRVRVHTTPAAEHTAATRTSLFALEEEDLGFPESYDDTKILSQSPVRLTRFDSEVLGEEDRRFVRQRFRG